MSSLLLFIPGILVCAALTGFFAGAETGALSANRHRLRHLQLEGDQRAGDVIKLLSDTQRILIVTLVGTNLFSILAALFGEKFFARILSAFTPHVSPQAVDLVSLLVMTPFLLLFGEILPKQFFREHPDELMLRIRKPLKMFSILFIPAVTFFNNIVFALLRPLGIQKEHTRARFTKEDLKNLVGSGDPGLEGKKGASPVRRQVDMIQNIFNLEKTLVREVMIPLADLIALPLHSSTIKSVLDTSRRSGYTRMPVYEDTIINMVGYVDLYEILHSLEGESKDVRSFVRSPFYVPETQRIDDLLQDMLSRHIPVAIAFDEHGGCSGFVTLEDILEEIVGEIDENSIQCRITYFEEKPGVYIVDPRMDLDDLMEELNIHLPKRHCETISGFIYSMLGRVPETNEIINYGQYRLQVLEVKPPKIKRVRIERIPEK
jgi:putative hemolysin